MDSLIPDRKAMYAWGLCCIAAVVAPLVPPWVTALLVAPSLVMCYLGVVRAQQDYRDLQEAIALEAKWREQRDRTR